MKFSIMTIVAAAAVGLASPALAEQVDIDLAGWSVFGDLGDASNPSATRDIGAGSVITGAQWIDLNYETQNDSWLSELVLSLNTSDGSLYWDSTVSDSDAPGTYSGSGTFPGPSTAGGPFTVLDDGILEVMAYDAFNNTGVDQEISSGILRVEYTPIPEPTAIGGLAIAGLALLRRRR